MSALTLNESHVAKWNALPEKEDSFAMMQSWGWGEAKLHLGWKPYRVERFLDERDYQVKRLHGIYLLEGLVCSGTVDLGPCDRSCFFFWREEWLEKYGRKGMARKDQVLQQAIRLQEMHMYVKQVRLDDLEAEMHSLLDSASSLS